MKVTLIKTENENVDDYTDFQKGGRMKVTDLFKTSTSDTLHGYCECGREVSYPKETCPCCNAKLTWDDIKHYKMIHS